jgi:hypothetical protein
MKKIFIQLIAACYLLIAPCVWAVDVGAVLDQEAVFSGAGGETGFAYEGILIPRVSGFLGDNAEFLVSFGFNY